VVVDINFNTRNINKIIIQEMSTPGSNASDKYKQINDSIDQTTNKIENETQKSVTLYMDQDKSMVRNIKYENSEVQFQGSKNAGSLHNSKDSRTNYIVKINPTSSVQ